MKRPPWATGVGILGIIVAGSGVVGSAQMAMLGPALSRQRQALGVLDQAVGSFTKASPRRDEESALLDDYLHGLSGAMGQLAPPPWYAAWCVAGGLMGMCSAGALALAASSLLQVRRWAVPFFYAAAALDMAVSLAKVVVAANASSLVASAAPAWALPAIVIEAVLVAAVAMGDKAAFRPPPASLTSSPGPASSPQAPP